MRHIIINVKYCLMFTRAHQIKFSLYFRLNYVVILFFSYSQSSPSSLHLPLLSSMMLKNYENDTAKNYHYETLTMTTTATGFDLIHLIFAVLKIIINIIIFSVSKPKTKKNGRSFNRNRWIEKQFSVFKFYPHHCFRHGWCCCCFLGRPNAIFNDF